MTYQRRVHIVLGTPALDSRLEQELYVLYDAQDTVWDTWDHRFAGFYEGDNSLDTMVITSSPGCARVYTDRVADQMEWLIARAQARTP